MAANNDFVYFTLTLIKSIMDSSSFEYQYDIYILNKDITKENIKRIKRLLSEKNNFQFFNINIGYYLSDVDFFVDQHLSVETYYRLMIPDIFADLNKVIYIDADMIVLADLAQLYKIDIENYALAGVHDIDVAGSYVKDPAAKKYLKNHVQMESPFDYVQAGLLIMNLAYMRKRRSSLELIELAKRENWHYYDQDVLNLVFKKEILYLDQKWNTLVNWSEGKLSRMAALRYAPAALFNEYQLARIAPNIVHYAGYQKPWDVPDMDMAEYFWKYARNTEVYESILKRIVNKQIKDTQIELRAGYQDNNGSKDFNGVRIKGVEDPIYVDGVMIKAINKFNKRYPIGSKKREHLRRLVKRFI